MRGWGRAEGRAAGGCAVVTGQKTGPGTSGRVGQGLTKLGPLRKAMQGWVLQDKWEFMLLEEWLEQLAVPLGLVLGADTGSPPPSL